MTHFTKLSRLMLLALLVAAPIALIGCKTTGPAERTGQKVDNAVGEVKEAAKDAGENIKEAAEEVEDEIDDHTTSK